MLQQTELAGSFTLPGAAMSVNRMGYGAMQLAGRDGNKLVWGPPRNIDEAAAGRERSPEAAGRGPEHGPADPAGDCLKKAVRPRVRRKLARWAQEAYRISERHAARLVKLAIGTLRYQSRKVFDEVLRRRLRELAGTHVHYGYRRLTVLLRREGWHVNAKRIYRLYREEELIVRTKQRRKMARRQRATTPAMAARPNQCWSMDFVSDKFADGRSFRILTVVDQFTRECVGLEADRAMTGMKVAQALERAKAERGSLPVSITVDNGSESRVVRWKLGQWETTCSYVLSGQAGRERIHREFQRPTAGREFERGVVFFAGRRAPETGEVPRALQSAASAQRLGGSHAGSLRGTAQAREGKS
jgi:putative transposase